MSIESLNQFQHEVMQDSALQEQFKTAAATSPETLSEFAIKVGAERGYSFTLEEIQAAVEDASSSPSAEETLKDEELEMVSGGATPVAGLVYGVVSKAAEQGVRDAMDGEEPTPRGEGPEWNIMRG